MRMALISPVFPWPAFSGDRIRILNQIKVFSSLGCKIDLYAISESNNIIIDEIEKHIDRMYVFKNNSNKAKAVIKTILTESPYNSNRVYSKELKEMFSNRFKQKEYDIIYVNFLNMLSLVSNLDSSFIILDQHNADRLYWSSFLKSSKLSWKYLAHKNIKNLSTYELKYYPKVDLVVAVSEDDANFTKNTVPFNGIITVAPNGVDLGFFKYKVEGTGNLQMPIKFLFCGSMDVTMNIDAVLHFIRDIFPLMRKRFPGCRLTIVGKDPTREVLELAQVNGVNVTGTVEDVRPFYWEADIFVAPIRYGGGTKLKILESMAAGTPIIGTDFATRGIGCKENIHYLRAESNQDFISKTEYLINNSQHYYQIARNGRQYVEDNFSWNHIYTKLYNIICNRLV